MDKKGEANKRWKMNNPEKVKEMNRRSSAKYRQKKRVETRSYELNIRRPNRMEKMKVLRAYKGNKCTNCGYEKEPRILHFHHLYNKKFNISIRISLTIEKLKEEADKCVLLCPNCHALTHLK